MDVTSIQPLIDWLTENEEWVAAAIFLTALSEAVALLGLLVPGALILFGVAMVAGNGILGPAETMLYGCAGAILGDTASFFLGRKFYDRIYSVWPFCRYPQVLTNAEGFFQHHGGKSIAIGRFVGPLRPVIPLVAGVLGMRSSSFITLNVLSAIAWAPAYVLPGYLIGASLNLEISLPNHFYAVLAVTTIAGFLLFYGFVKAHIYLQPHSLVYEAVREYTFRHPRARKVWLSFAHRRGSLPDFPLASCLMFIFGLGLFTLLAMLAVSSDQLQLLNQQVLDFLQALRFPLLDQFFVTITLMGDQPYLLLLATIAMAVLFLKKRDSAAIHLLVAGVVCVLAVHGLKLFMALPRPEIVLMEADNFGFPSGHAAGSILLYGLTASFIAQETPPAGRWKIYGVAMMLPLLISFSRIYLGVHWFSDIIGGFLLGLILVSLTRISYSRHDRIPITADKWIILLAIAWVVITVGYVFLRFDDAMSYYQPIDSALPLNQELPAGQD